MALSEFTKCNMCGVVFNIWDTNENNTIEKKLGYGSKYDEEKIKIRLCCNCLDSLIDSCVISPIIK